MESYEYVEFYVKECEAKEVRSGAHKLSLNSVDKLFKAKTKEDIWQALESCKQDGEQVNTTVESDLYNLMAEQNRLLSDYYTFIDLRKLNEFLSLVKDFRKSSNCFKLAERLLAIDILEDLSKVIPLAEPYPEGKMFYTKKKANELRVMVEFHFNKLKNYLLCGSSWEMTEYEALRKNFLSLIYNYYHSKFQYVSYEVYATRKGK